MSAQAYVAVGDFDGHIGLGKKCSSEVATCAFFQILAARLRNRWIMASTCSTRLTD